MRHEARDEGDEGVSGALRYTAKQQQESCPCLYNYIEKQG
jgi:hypothetical protein